MAKSFRSEDEARCGLRANGYDNPLRLRRKTFRGDLDGISGGPERGKVGCAVGVGGLLAMGGDFFCCERNLCCGDGAAGGVHYVHEERTAEFLRKEMGRRCDRSKQSDDKGYDDLGEIGTHRPFNYRMANLDCRNRRTKLSNGFWGKLPPLQTSTVASGERRTRLR